MSKIGDYVKKSPIATGEDATIKDVVNLMAQNNIGLVVIVDKSNKPIGVVSERDIIKALARGVKLEDKALDIATKGNLLTARRDDDIYTVLKAMRERGIRHVLVLNEDGTLSGVVSIRDLVEDRALKTIGDKVWWPKPEE